MIEKIIDDSRIRKAAEILFRESHPSKVILFGSHARGDATAESDIDFLVIEDDVKDKRKEMVRLKRALRPLRLPIDVIVEKSATVNEIRDLPGTAIYWALKEGRVMHEAH
jgi:predicted nucleotidyltransferase